ncbi:MAG: hypothetical protein Q7R80_02535 [bacterium]|nr:hypothetical protein [bacterium]
MTKRVGAAAAFLAAIIILWSSGTIEPIRSPWSVVPAPLFLLYALITVLSIRYSVFGIAIALGLSSLVAILVYPLGFGFDHFIHAAAEGIIATTGSLSPPPLFYSAHYGLTVLLADLLPGVDVALADRLLAPLLTIALLVPLAYRTLRSVLPEHAVRWGLSSLLIVPFLPLAVSTPQATANIFALATVLLLMAFPPPLEEGERVGVRSQTHGWSMKRWITPLVTALASLLFQPMTGIIAIAIVAMAFTLQRGWRMLSTVVAALGVIGIPLAFTIADRIIPNLDLHVTFNPLPAIQQLGSALMGAMRIAATDFSTADALALARVALPLLWIALAAMGAAWLRRPPSEESLSQFRAKLRKGTSVLVGAPIVALLAAACVAATVTIPTLLAEEQTQFPLRLVQLAALLATPLVGIGLGTVLDRLHGRLPQLTAAVAIGAAATFTLLLAYPRDDAQARSGLWSVSASDIAAVHVIADDAGDTPYVVLANQMLGAAAIREFGFRPAHTVCAEDEFANGRESTKNCSEILAFPLPAGGPIARQYWEYVSQEPIPCFSPPLTEGEREGVTHCPSRAPIDSAMNLVGADRAYVILHDYWRNYALLAATTSAMADAEIGSFKHIRVFRFSKVPLGPVLDSGSR